MAMKRFERRLHILLTVDEHRMMNELAEREGLRPSDEVRQLIRRAHAQAFGEQLAAKPKAVRSATKSGAARKRR